RSGRFVRDCPRRTGLPGTAGARRALLRRAIAAWLGEWSYDLWRTFWGLRRLGSRTAPVCPETGEVPRSPRPSPSLDGVKPGGGGGDGLHGAPDRHRQHVVERPVLDVLTGQVGAERLGAPHGHAGERLAVGQVEAPDPQDRVHAEDLARPAGRLHEAEVEDAPLRDQAGGSQLGLDGAEMAERLAK